MNTIRDDANFLLAEMRRLTQEASGSAVSAKPKQTEHNFADYLAQALQNATDLQTAAHQLQHDHELSNSSVFAQVEAALQTANYSVNALVEVRDKAINAYKEIANMQV